jgi:DNA polymerase
MEEKIALAKALDMTDDYLRDGYARDRGEYVFACDPPETAVSQAAAPLSEGDSLEMLTADIRGCTACPLHRTREKAVFGDGAGGPLVLILGDVPEKEDEEAGMPFAGPAGELLDRMLSAIALSRETNCYLTNRVKCRPPADGSLPGPEEFAGCASFLKRELALLKPLVILMFTKTSGWGENPVDGLETAGVPFFSTHHPALIQANGQLKRPAWERLKALSSTLSGLDRDYAQALKTTGKG